MRIFIAAFLLAASVPAAADLGLAPTTLDFGAQSMGTTSPSSAITVTNNGTATATVASVVVGTGNFELTHNCASLAPGASCTITVAFHPLPQAGALNSTAAITDTLAVHADAPASVASLQGLAEKSLVTHFYGAILRRAPDVPGKAYWEGEALRMQALGANVNETWYAMAAYFYASGEYASQGRDDAGFVEDLYRTFLDRDNDAGGLAFWVDELAAGVPRGVVLSSFMFSAEFEALSGSVFGVPHVAPENTLVVDMYRGLLGRLPDSSGFMAFLGGFRDLVCNDATAIDGRTESMSAGFVASAEYQSRQRSNALFVGDLYNAFLRRGGERSGVLFWVHQLDTGAMSRDQLRIAFRQSAEFAQRAHSVVITGCAPAVVLGPGTNGSLALAADGLPMIAYTDAGGNFLWFVRCADAACVTRSTPALLFSRTTQVHPMSAVRVIRAADGMPLVFFSVGREGDGSSDVFWSAKCADVDCTVVTTAIPVPGALYVPGSLTGYADFVDAALGSEGKPWIIYQTHRCNVVCQSYPLLAHCSDVACTAVDSVVRLVYADVAIPVIPPGAFYVPPGAWESTARLAIAADGLPVTATRWMAKYDTAWTTQVLKCADIACTNASTPTPLAGLPASLSIAGREGVAMASGADGLPVLWYGANSDTWRVGVSKCVDASCANRTPGANVDSARLSAGGGVGDSDPPSAALLGGGIPALAYRDGLTGTLRVAGCSDAQCSAGTAVVLPRFAASLYQPKLAAAADGKPMLLFADANGLMYFLKCGNADCSP